MELLDEETVALLVRRGYTHKAISGYYKSLNPGIRGLSERSVHRFCHSKSIHRISDDEIDGYVEKYNCRKIWHIFR